VDTALNGEAIATVSRGEAAHAYRSRRDCTSDACNLQRPTKLPIGVNLSLPSDEWGCKRCMLWEHAQTSAAPVSSSP